MTKRNARTPAGKAKAKKTARRCAGKAGGLTAAQEKFCQHYALNNNGSAAYREAYPRSRKWTSQSQAERASKLLADAKIQSRIAELAERVQERAEKRFDVTADKVLQELAKIGFSNMFDYVSLTSGGEPYIDLSKVEREQAAAISEVVVEDFTEGRGDDSRDVRRVKFKLHDKRASLVDLGKYLKMFTEKHEHTGAGGGPIETKITLDELDRSERDALRGILERRVNGSAAGAH